MLDASDRGYLRAGILTLLLTGSLFPPVLGVSVVVPVAALTALGVCWTVLAGLPRIPPGLMLTVALFAVLASDRLWREPMTAYGVDKFDRLVTVTLLSALAATLIRDRSDLLAFARVWTVVAVLLAAGALTGLNNAGGRATGLDESNPIWIARAITTGIVAVAWLVWTRRLHWLLGCVVVALLGAGNLSTGSRGPFLGALVGLLALSLTAERSRLRRLLVVGLGLAAGLVAVLYLPGAGASRITAFAYDPTGELSGNTRAKYWSETWRLIEAHPLGLGFGNWERATNGPAQYPHNLWLEVTAEAGWLVGGFLIVTTAVVLVRLAKSARRNSSASLVFALLAAEVVAASSSGDLNERTFYAFLVLGWAVGVWSRRDNGTSYQVLTTRARTPTRRERELTRLAEATGR